MSMKKPAPLLMTGDARAVVGLPRVIRQRDAPAYLGMDRNRFDAEVRPGLTEVPIGDRSIAYDRADLDAWWEAYKAARGRPGCSKKGGATCAPGRKASSSPATARGWSTSSIEASGSSPGLAESPRTTPKPGSGRSKPDETKRKLSNVEKLMAS